MDIKRYPMVLAGISILAIGFVGGTVYHATRSSEIWLIADYMPIYFALIAGCIYLWHRITGNWFLVLLYSLLPATALRIIATFFQPGERYFIAVSYLAQVIMLLVPVMIHCWLNKFRHLRILGLAFASFAVALSFRELDAASVKFIPAGTHFLWHIFGGFSAFLMLQYIYNTSDFFYNKRKMQVA
jgi:hemolysin III